MSASTVEIDPTVQELASQLRGMSRDERARRKALYEKALASGAGADVDRGVAALLLCGLDALERGEEPEAAMALFHEIVSAEARALDEGEAAARARLSRFGRRRR
jgi:hypothetical protein